jgi:hypothetical protein
MAQLRLTPKAYCNTVGFLLKKRQLNPALGEDSHPLAPHYYAYRVLSQSPKASAHQKFQDFCSITNLIPE